MKCRNNIHIFGKCEKTIDAGKSVLYIMKRHLSLNLFKQEVIQAGKVFSSLQIYSFELYHNVNINVCCLQNPKLTGSTKEKPVY